MELWVRSQDKSRLVKTNMLKLFEPEIYVDTRYNHFRIYVNEYLAGEYESKERALEVLDEIQNFITRTDEVSYVQNSLGIELQGTTEKGIVYNMPKE